MGKVDQPTVVLGDTPDNDEFIATHPGHDLVHVDFRLQDIGIMAQQQVVGVMAKRIVHRLELVEVATRSV